tara:strand:+ start:212 stop:814 length:603 start_codon:yes stop_codon:yes gene_type:complete
MKYLMNLKRFFNKKAFKLYIIYIAVLVCVGVVFGRGQSPIAQEFDYETSLWLWQDTLEVIQHPKVREVIAEISVHGDWWLGVETLSPTDVDGRLTYKSEVIINISKNTNADGTMFVCDLNGPFDGSLDFMGSSGRLNRDMDGDGNTVVVRLDPTPFRGKEKYYMPIRGHTEHEIVVQGQATHFGFFQETTRLHLILQYRF